MSRGEYAGPECRTAGGPAGGEGEGEERHGCVPGGAVAGGAVALPCSQDRKSSSSAVRCSRDPGSYSGRTI